MHKDVGHDAGHHIATQKNYEQTDIQVKWILYFGLMMVILTLVGYVVGTFFTVQFRADPAMTEYRPTPVALEEQHDNWNLPVRLQVDPPRALTEFKTTQHATESSFGVVSDEPEIYRIPVETAMKIVAEKGLPVFPKVAAPAEGAAKQ